MAENKKRSIQFRRNISQIYDNSADVKTAIDGNKDYYLDGEQIFGRYWIDSTKKDTISNNIATLVGLVHVSGNTSGDKVINITYSDAVGMEALIKAGAITAGTVNDVDITIATGDSGNSFSVTVSGSNVPVGDDYDVIEYNTAFTASTAEEVAKTDTVDEAINKVEKSVSALVDEVLDNEKVTAEAINQLNESSGFDENGAYTANTATGMKYISGTTNLSEAVEALDNAVKTAQSGGISEVEIEQLTSGTTHQYTAADADLYALSSTTQAGDVTVDTFQLTYTPYSPSELQVPTTVGDIEKGTKASELNGETISKILDDILFPTVYLDLTSPSVSIATAASYSSTVIAGTAAPSLKLTYKRGGAAVNDGVTASKNYTGNLTGATWVYAYTAGAANTNAGVDASGTTISQSSPTTITTAMTASTSTTVAGYDYATGATTSLTLATVGTYYFRGTVDYAAGETLTTSKGDTSSPIRYASLDGKENTTKATVTNPHPASTITSSYGVTINVSLPIYANSGSTYSADMKTLPLQTWGAMTIQGIAFPTTNAITPIVIKTPRKLASFNSYNELAKDYNVPQMSSLSTPTTETINGVTYYVYTWTGSEVSARNYKIITY